MHSQGVSGRKISLLRYLFEAGPRTIGQLGDYLYVSDSSISELVTKLEQDGFVTRARSPDDNRVVIVTLAPAGRALAQEPPSGGVPLLRERLKTLPEERLSTINEAVAEMIKLLGIQDGC
jgi:DNA-binding MarR family transcriptional regulator